MHWLRIVNDSQVYMCSKREKLNCTKDLLGYQYTHTVSLLHNRFPCTNLCTRRHIHWFCLCTCLRCGMGCWHTRRYWSDTGLLHIQADRHSCTCSRSSRIKSKTTFQNNEENLLLVFIQPRMIGYISDAESMDMQTSGSSVLYQFIKLFPVTWHRAPFLQGLLAQGPSVTPWVTHPLDPCPFPTYPGGQVHDTPCMPVYYWKNNEFESSTCIVIAIAFVS